ncbi:MAG: hypothetical protein RBU29_11905 [bacterium]|jgi:hypothetical protein|nr:hypothetical protein [bacterium]
MKPTRWLTLLGYVALWGLTAVVTCSQDRLADFSQDGHVSSQDLFYMMPQWYTSEIGADLNQDRQTNKADLLQFQSQWQAQSPVNPYPEGRETGIYAITRLGERSWKSGELEIDILPPAAGKTAPHALPTPQPPAVQFPTNQMMLDLLSRNAADLQGNPHPMLLPQAEGRQFGTQYPDIGTFWNWAIWVGWGANFSETYVPNGEAYNWVTHFAPDGVYVSLQEAKFHYSSVDVFAGVYSFWGALVVPSGNRLRVDYLKSLLSIGVSLNLSVKLIPYGPSPSVVASQGVSFFHPSGSNALERGIQFSAGYSTSFELMPLPFDLPISVSLDYESDVRAGFYPIILWDLPEEGEGNPLDTIIQGLTEVAGNTSEYHKTIAAQQFASMILPVMTYMSSQSPSSDGAYFNQFLQTNTRTVSGEPGSIDDMIKQTETWKQTGDPGQLPPVVKQAGQFRFPIFQQYMKGAQGGTQMGFELGYIHGYEASGRTDTIYEDGLVVIPCSVGDWCYIEVTAEEIAALIPGAKPADFEGVPVYFDLDPFSYLTSQKEYVWAPIEDGIAWHEFLLQSNAPVVIGISLDRRENRFNKNVELKRRKIVPKETAFLFANEKTIHGSTMILESAAQDENGLPLVQSATVTFYDHRGRFLGGPVMANEGMASIEIVAHPTVPEITRFVTTKVGYSEEDAHTGYSLSGYGISTDADVLINGISINTFDGWVWQIMNSRQILFLPPDEQSLFTQPTTIQIRNPKGIPSNEFQYTP